MEGPGRTRLLVLSFLLQRTLLVDSSSFTFVPQVAFVASSIPAWTNWKERLKSRGNEPDKARVRVITRTDTDRARVADYGIS